MRDGDIMSCKIYWFNYLQGQFNIRAIAASALGPPLKIGPAIPDHLGMPDDNLSLPG